MGEQCVCVRVGVGEAYGSGCIHQCVYHQARLLISPLTAQLLMESSPPLPLPHRTHTQEDTRTNKYIHTDTHTHILPTPISTHRYCCSDLKHGGMGQLQVR